MRTIYKETGDRMRHLTLLLLADEELNAIQKYVNDGDMFIVDEDGSAVCEAIVTTRPDGDIEIKSLATLPDWQKKGCARDVVAHIRKRYAGKAPRLYVGTGEPNRAFYERLGFTYAYTVKNFFVDNYANPIIDGGMLLVDMIYFSMPL